ncbi:MAG: (Fe-S)-binding protein [Pseudomonadota bacterium]
MLEDRRAALETCAFCPKLSRSACPISDAEALETVTPWGKMSGTYDVARGAAPPSREHAALPWACTHCFACREICEHRTPVAETLNRARAEYTRLGLAPAGATIVRHAHRRRLARLDERIGALRVSIGHRDDAPTAVVLGCEYALHLPEEALDAVRAAAALFGPIRLLSGCCGQPLDAAGDPGRARELEEAMVAGARGAGRRIAVDSGCAYRLRSRGFVPFAEAASAALGKRSTEPVFGDRVLRYHDPCLLGRGLGCYDAPRRIVSRASTRAVQEFTYRRERARCSGAGALLPVTRPATAEAIARRRVSEHEALGGGSIVTACGASVRRFRAVGAEVIDLSSVVRRLVLP